MLLPFDISDVTERHKNWTEPGKNVFVNMKIIMESESRGTGVDACSPDVYMKGW